VNELLQDLRYGVRTLRKSPGFAAVAVLTLGIGIGANTAIFSFVNGVLLKPLPYGEPERIVRVMEKPPGGGTNGISTLNYLDWEKDNTVFQYMAAQTDRTVTLTGVNEPVQLRGSRVSPRYFDIFGIKATLGRTFAVDEGQLGKDRVAVLSHALWDSQFGGDPSVIGRSITLDGAPHTIIGVLPAGGAFDRAYAQIWRPLAFEPQNMTRNFHWFFSFAKLKRGVTAKQATAQMDTIGARIARDYPDSNKGWGVSIEPFADTVVGTQLRQSLYVLLAAVGMVLLIGCANLANLTLARGTAREREVAIRASVGAGRWRLVRQFLTENVLLSICGGVFGMVLGLALKRGLELAVPPYMLPREADVSIDTQVWLFTLALAVFTGIVFGLAPALQSHAAEPGRLHERGRPGRECGRAA
jgi:putative ABC transport system permease protein